MLNLQSLSCCLHLALLTTTIFTNLPIVWANNISQDSYQLKQDTNSQENKNVVTSDDNKLRFQLNQCSRTNKAATIFCSLLVTNLHDRDAFFSVGTSASFTTTPIPRVFDSSGNEYSAKFIQLGERKDKKEVVSKIIPGIPIKLVINFEVPPSVSQLTILEVNHTFLTRTKTEFRNVDIVEVTTNPKPTTTRNRKR